VTLIERGLPGSGATGDSFAWIGDAGVLQGPTATLRSQSTADYRRLEDELPGVLVRWSGSVSWSNEAASTGSRAPLGPGQRVVDAQAVAALEPALRQPPRRATYAPGDGVVDPVVVTEALVDGARGHGARVLLCTAVTGLLSTGRRIVGVTTTARGAVYADTVVVATGADLPVMCASVPVELPVTASPSLLLRFQAPPGLVNTVVSTRELDVHQTGDGMLVATTSYRGESTRRDLHEAAKRVSGRIEAMFRGADGLVVQSVRVGLRPMPADGEPLVGALLGTSGLCLAVMHSGLTLAPTVGRLLAEELDTGRHVDALQNCRPSRFAPHA
jgi:glycine/D-amino acid oxidase-like deaminating enzyme